MLVVGGAQAVNVLVSIVRMKFFAVMLGPNGVGLLGVLTNLQVIAVTIAGLGMSNSGVRQLADAKQNASKLANTVNVLLYAHWIQGIIAASVFWILRSDISTWVFGDTSYALEVGLVGCAAIVSLVSVAHTTIIQGTRQVDNFSRVTAYAAILGTILGLIAVWLRGTEGLVWYLIMQPLVTWAIAARYTRMNRQLIQSKRTRRAHAKTWIDLVALGIPFMLSGLVSAFTLLLIRGLLTQELGLDDAGFFAAAWGITITYVGLLLSAITTDYYPRLTELANDKKSFSMLINDQIQIGLAVGGPFLILLIGFAPWILTVLYSAEFSKAVEVLQWQALGNVFKIASWAIVFGFMAVAKSKTFLILEIHFNCVFFFVVWQTLPIFGLDATGIGFCAAYAVFLIAASALSRKGLGFIWQRLSYRLLVMHMALAVVTLCIASQSATVGAAVSSLLAFVSGTLGLRVVLIKIGPVESGLVSSLRRIYRAVGWPIDNQE